MVRIRAYLSFAVVCLLIMAVHGDEKPGKKIQGWGNLTDPDGDCEITQDAQKVTIKLPDTAHDYAAELQRWNAPRILGETTGDFIAEVKVTGVFKPSDTSTIDNRRPYNGAGLLLIKDKNNYINLHRGAVYIDNRVRQYANFELRKEGELATSRYELDLEDQDTWLRLERRGSRVFALASHDGLHWKVYEDPIEFEFPETVQVGVEARNSSDKPFSCTLESYTVFRKVQEPK
jgi:regulation of enolase protein 1 (concanavalin A-like superfamily)